MILDVEASLRALKESPKSGVDMSKVILFGRSLGGAVALAAADKYPHLVSFFLFLFVCVFRGLVGFFRFFFSKMYCNVLCFGWLLLCDFYSCLIMCTVDASASVPVVVHTQKV